MKGTATHFIEQYGWNNIYYFSGLNAIGNLKNCLEETSSSSYLITVAIFYITPKKVEEPEWPCDECYKGEMKQVGYTSPSGTTKYECSKCWNTLSFP